MTADSFPDFTTLKTNAYSLNMSSPMHSFLFSPPTSPPLPGSGKHDQVEVMTNHGLTSIKKLLLPTDMSRASSADGSSSYSPSLGAASSSVSELKARSPRTPQQQSFASCQNMYPSSYPTPRGRFSQPATVAIQVDDVDATPRSVGRPASSPATPMNRGSRASQTQIVITSPGAPNVPSTSASIPTHSGFSIPTSLPRPVLRMLFLFTLIVSSALLLTYVPKARLPSLRAAAMSRRLALHPDGRAYLEEFEQPAGSFQAARDRDYVPPKIMAPHMLRRGLPTSRALPASHELLALQSYLLDNDNVLPYDLDPSAPLDAARFLGVDIAALGRPGSAAEKAWLKDVEKEIGNEVVIWYGGNGNTQLPSAILDILQAMPLAADRVPTLMPCHSRPDKDLLSSVLDRMSVPLRHTPLVMIGNTPILGGEDALEDLRLSGKLHQLLASIGWIESSADQALEPVQQADEYDELD